MSTNLDTTDLLATATNQPEFSVGELSRAIKGVLEGEFGRVRVRGEITGFKRHGSGHLYFRLKDAEAVLDAVCWRGSVAKLGIAPQDGLEVIATGRITTYPGRSSYQVIVDQMELAGEGALLKLLEDRRRALAAEGLFAPERKRPLPYLPGVVGVVTSPTGAVIRDILHRLRERCPRHVLLWPVQVQGEGAAEQVARAVRGFNIIPADGSGPAPRPDVLIVARGGGSLEDLWAFNEEVAVRAVATSDIPVIAAVGHETDTTLIDFAADRRAPTPTAAAEMAVPVLSDLVLTLGQLGQRLAGASWRGLEQRALQLRSAQRGLPEPVQLVEHASQRVDDLTERLGLALRAVLVSAAQHVRAAAGSLRHPREVLELKGQTLTACSRALDQAARQQLLAAEHSVARIDAARRLPAALARNMDDAERRLAHAGALLGSYSYERVLDRGFVLVRGPDGPVTSAAEATPGLAITLQFRGSETRGATIDRDSEPSGLTKPKRNPKRRDGRQGRLL
jgi:exodeoxyribonuclease VII large subunit